MTIPAGRLREYLIITRLDQEELPDGSMSVGTERELLQTYCTWDQRAASIDVIAAQDNISQVFVFKLRYRTDIIFQIGDRVQWRDRSLKIHSFQWDILRTVLTIICQTHTETTSSG